MRSIPSRMPVVLAMAALLAIPMAGQASARGGKGRTASTMALAMVDDVNGDGLPNHRDTITFEVSTTATDRPFVGVRCWQGSTFMYDAYVGYFPGYWLGPSSFDLHSMYWADGVDASCTARLFYYDRQGRERILSTMSFVAAA